MVSIQPDERSVNRSKNPHPIAPDSIDPKTVTSLPVRQTTKRHLPDQPPPQYTLTTRPILPTHPSPIKKPTGRIGVLLVYQ